MEKRVKFEVHFRELDILNVDGFGPVLLNHGRYFVGHVGNRLDTEPRGSSVAVKV